MKRISASILLTVATLALTGCVGNTDPATQISIHSAQLNGHGYTDDGPAYWWWEYSSDRSLLEAGAGTRVCGFGTRCGPASSSSTVNLATIVTGLGGNTTYYFRMCGQDVPNPPSENEPPICGHILSFKTLAGTSYAFDRKWGSYGTANGQFNGPTGVATDASGNVYVADSGNNRIQKFGPGGGFIAKWGSFGSGDGQFNSPQGIAIDRGTNTVYVADSGNNRIQKFSSGGGFVAKWGSFGSGDGKFKSPKGIATDGTNVYVADSGNNRIQKFSSGGGFVAKWGSSGSGDGQFNGPAGIFAKTNTVFVADGGNNRIQAFFAPDGSFITKSGTFGSNNGQFKNPSGIAIDPGSSSSDIYVADAGNNRIQKFQPLCCFTTNFITKWGRNGGDGSSGSGDGEFNGPQGVATDQFDKVYVADTGNNRIERFKPTQ